jgi:molecular chaperone GrpE
MNENNDRQEEIVVRDKRRFTAEGERRTDIEEDVQQDAPTAEQAAEEGEAIKQEAELLAEQDAIDAAAVEEIARRAEQAERLAEDAERRATDAENRLSEYAAAYQRFKDEQEKTLARLERDQDKKVRETLARTFAGILEALDNLDRALEHAEDGPVVEGVRLVRKQLLDLLSREGLERLDVEGKPFDPEHSEAVMVTPVEDDYEKNVVLEELRPGYRFRDIVLRPAQVRVGGSAG